MAMGYQKSGSRSSDSLRTRPCLHRSLPKGEQAADGPRLRSRGDLHSTEASQKGEQAWRETIPGRL